MLLSYVINDQIHETSKVAFFYEYRKDTAPLPSYPLGWSEIPFTVMETTISPNVASAAFAYSRLCREIMQMTKVISINVHVFLGIWRNGR